MKRSIMLIGFALLMAGLISVTPALAQNEATGQDTMDVVEPGQTPEEVDRRITLPESASEQGVESSRKGLETANEAREKGREFGQERAEEARERGKDRGEEARERAKERAEEAREQKRDEDVRDRRPSDRAGDRGPNR